MNKQSSRRSSLFLLELIAAILFFCLASAVCVRFFVKSHTLSQETRNLDMAVNQASTFAELFRSDADLFSILSEQCPDGILSANGDIFTLYYDEEWTPCAEETAAFSLTIEQKVSEDITAGYFVVADLQRKSEIYTLETEKYTGGEALSDE